MSLVIQNFIVPTAKNDYEGFKERADVSRIPLVLQRNNRIYLKLPFRVDLDENTGSLRPGEAHADTRSVQQITHGNR